MIEGTYDVAIDTPRHHKRGTLALMSQDERIAARLKVGDEVDAEFTGTCAGKEFDFAGGGEFGALGTVEFTAHGSVWGNSIDVHCESNVGKISLFGTRLSGSVGDFKSSHDYIMSASKAEFANDDNTMYSGRYADGG